jgi:BolA family transcriptional regulator, general stress-responsive regulator
MSIEQLIHAAVEQNLKPDAFEIINESHKHKGHAGDDGSGQTHFKLMIVSSVFTGMSRIDRQRLVNTMLQTAFSRGLHAISMKLYSPEEKS